MQPISAASETEMTYAVQLEGGKIIEAVPEGQSTMYKIQFRTGGELPARLCQKYTNLALAVRDIQQYVKEYKPRKRTSKESSDA